jgi:AcrR family transcriptional regulator
VARTYESKERARRQAATRQRIVEAAHELHGTVGFGATISAVAERAGVQRLTVYRHFPTEQELVRACAVHFFTRDPLPDPAPWRRIGDPEARLRVALSHVYAYFGRNEGNLANFQRDLSLKPFLRDLGAPMFEHWGVMRDVLTRGWGARGRRAGRLRAAIALALELGTWRSLVRQQGLSDEEAIDVMARMIRCI